MKLLPIRYFCIACFCIFLGCGASKIERTVQDDNIFYSSNRPKIRIKINPDFKFKEEKDEKDPGFSEGFGERIRNTKISKFFFEGSISGKPRAVLINIRELKSPGWYYKSPIFRMKNEFESGHIKILGKKYEYCIFIAARPDNYIIAKGIGKLFGVENNGMIQIFYLEQVTGDWSNQDLLTADQQRQLNEFVEDSKRDIQIIE